MQEADAAWLGKLILSWKDNTKPLHLLLESLLMEQKVEDFITLFQYLKGKNDLDYAAEGILWNKLLEGLNTRPNETFSTLLTLHRSIHTYTFYWHLQNISAHLPEQCDPLVAASWAIGINNQESPTGAMFRFNITLSNSKLSKLQNKDYLSKLWNISTKEMDLFTVQDWKNWSEEVINYILEILPEARGTEDQMKQIKALLELGMAARACEKSYVPEKEYLRCLIRAWRDKIKFHCSYSGRGLSMPCPTPSRKLALVAKLRKKTSNRNLLDLECTRAEMVSFLEAMPYI